MLQAGIFSLQLWKTRSLDNQQRRLWMCVSVQTMEMQIWAYIPFHIAVFIRSHWTGWTQNHTVADGDFCAPVIVQHWEWVRFIMPTISSVCPVSRIGRYKARARELHLQFLSLSHTFFWDTLHTLQVSRDSSGITESITVSDYSRSRNARFSCFLPSSSWRGEQLKVVCGWVRKWSPVYTENIIPAQNEGNSEAE